MSPSAEARRDPLPGAHALDAWERAAVRLIPGRRRAAVSRRPPTRARQSLQGTEGPRDGAREPGRPPAAGRGPEGVRRSRSAEEHRRQSRGALLRLVRPWQWSKNLVVFAAPFTAGVLDRLGALGAALGAFVAFSAVASGVYCLNDVLDARRDRLHDIKRMRPVASGMVSPARATLLGLALIWAGLVDAWVVGGAGLFGTLGSYAALSVAYSVTLKRIPLVELACVATGFVLRAVAGGIAVHVGLSAWFLLVVSFGSLMVASGKRSAEHLALGPARRHFRHVLKHYSLSRLRAIRRIAAGGTLACFVMWAFLGLNPVSSRHHGSGWAEIAIIPFVIGTVRLERRFSAGAGEEPERLFYSDRVLEVCGFILAVLIAVAVYG